jgi:hypothetical protein
VARSHFAARLRDFADLGVPVKGWGCVVVVVVVVVALHVMP